MIISTLGMTGGGKEAYYDCTVLGKKSGDYRSSTDMLLKNYDGQFYFLGTKTAVDFQRGLLEFDDEKTTFITVEDNNLDDIFEEVFRLLSSARGETVVLDITHGYRHQPYIALFASTVSKFLDNPKLKIIFAMEKIARKEYRYIYMGHYIETSQISLPLMNFLETLNYKSNLKIPYMLPFEEFSKALMSNDIPKLEEVYLKLATELVRAQNDNNLKHLSSLYQKIENELSIFKDFDKLKYYDKYIKLANLMMNKGYILISITYAHEGLREYVRYSFNESKLKTRGILYKQNQAVMGYIDACYTDTIVINTEEKANNLGFLARNPFYKKHNEQLYTKNLKEFEQIAIVYRKIREIRNTLAHINYQHIREQEIKQFQSHLEEITKIVQDDILKNIKK